MIIWDEEKNKELIKERNISFEEVVDIILEKKYLGILENPSRDNQYIFIISLHDYTHVVPFVIDESENIFLKTIFPSRKYHKIYGGQHES